MKRLVTANIDEVANILSDIKNGSNELKDVYYNLFNKLNELYDKYPSLYKQIAMTVELPTNDDAKHISEFNVELIEILDHFKDLDYLSQFIK